MEVDDCDHEVELEDFLNNRFGAYHNSFKFDLKVCL